MSTGTVVRPNPAKSETVETSPDGQHKVAYIGADGVFADLPVTIVDMLTEMTKAAFAKELIAAGTVTDSRLSAMRADWLRERIISMHASWRKANEQAVLNKARKFYLELRARGFSKEDAAKTARYNPLD